MEYNVLIPKNYSTFDDLKERKKLRINITSSDSEGLLKSDQGLDENHFISLLTFVILFNDVASRKFYYIYISVTPGTQFIIKGMIQVDKKIIAIF
ncbi:hypothetical protein RCL_jg27938.t1 [Rhizophagus clarus]|uniref:Uncharacterized protein n=1 Tax=Rhizophagus clarus TaxID=94130 RepID=A0A8H3LVG9_9GLOM|nr:hypothetical protein RCL_jg27938.t1 [Rhizophagus clarus]